MTVKDDNYKPEMAIALTNFECLSNFASFDDICKFLDEIEIFRSLFKTESIE